MTWVTLASLTPSINCNSGLNIVAHATIFDSMGAQARRMSPEDSAPQFGTDEALLVRLQRFLLEYVESYEELEVLLLLAQSRLAWPVDAIGKSSALSDMVVTEALEALSHRSLVASLRPDAATWFYAPESAQLDQTVTDLANAYESERLDVMKMMTANSIRRLRATAADAFDVLTSRKTPGA